MTKLSKTFTVLLILIFANLFNVDPAQALIPPLPSSFYGTVKVNGENVADGMMVKASINGQVYATGYTQTYEGNSVYSLDVPGDDGATTMIEGGRDGDVIQFVIGEAPAIETGTWKSATNVNINLTAASAAPLNTPQATPTPVPTQTAIKPPKKSPTSTPAVEALPTEPISFPTLTSKPDVAVSTKSGSQVSPQATSSIGQPQDNPTTMSVQMSPTITQSSNPDGNGSRTSIFIAAVIILLAIFMVWALRFFRKPNRSKER